MRMCEVLGNLVTNAVNIIDGFNGLASMCVMMMLLGVAYVAFQTADEFVGPDIGRAIITLLRLQKVMENRYAWLRAHRRRKIEPADGLSVITSIFDEIAASNAEDVSGMLSAALAS